MKRLLAGARIDPRPVTGATTVRELVDGALLAYNGARLREAAQLFVRRMLEDDVTIGVSLSGALTPAGLGMSCLIPLIEAGFVDWIVSTGANLYHDTHFGIGLTMHRGRPDLDDVALRADGVVRIYDIVLGAKRSGGKSAVLILGGGSPKNFVLQTEPQVQEVLGIEEKGHDYYVQFTDARVDTGGLSGATPSEAVSWGKVDPEKLPDTVVCYCDSTIALPLLTAYALATHAPRKPKRLYERRDALMESLVREYHQAHDFGPDGGLKRRS